MLLPWQSRELDGWVQALCCKLAYLHVWCSKDRPGVQAALEAAGIYPSETMTYETSEIEDALTQRFGAKPEVMCACGGGGSGWRTQCDTAPIDSVRQCSRTKGVEASA